MISKNTQTVLDRGYNYFLEGRIQDIPSNSDNEHRFTIEGTSDYQVVVKLGEEGEITFFFL